MSQQSFTNIVRQSHTGSIEHIDPPIELALGWKPRDQPIREHIRQQIQPPEVFAMYVSDTEERNFFYGYINEGQPVVVQKLAKFIQWKIDIKYDNYLLQPIMEPKIYQFLPITIYHTDLQGHPVMYLRANEANVSELKNLPQEVIEDYFTRTCIHLDKIKHCIREQSDYPMWRHTIVVDLKGIGFFGITKIKSTLKTLGDLLGTHFPETAHVIYIINADWKFRKMKSIFDFMFAERTRDKVQVIGSSYLEKLATNIPVENIPMDYGGQHQAPLQPGGIYLPKSELDIHYPHVTI